ncbi:hypothetical protein [Archangium violaceum]|uniref:hypothetical protein n=1 Tax=Archangium violaceum TaxID=83451 RepID=UPI0037BE32BF
MSPRFFVLEEGVLWSRYDAEVDKAEPVNRGDAARCSRCGAVIGMRTWHAPYQVELTLHGKEFGDFIKALGDDILVSERFARAFRDEGLTGLEGFHPVEVLRVGRKRRGPKPSNIPSYFAVTACFGRAAVDVARSHIRGAQPPACEECRSMQHYRSIHGFSLEPGTWQGEDIFRPRGLFGDLIVSERFERFVARHGFTNLRMTPIEEYVWDPHAPEPLPSTKEGSA